MDYRMPLYQQIEDTILNKVKNKEYLPGEAIPSERTLAETYGVNRMTVKRALNNLVEKGYLYRVPSKGTFVKKENTQKVIWGNDNYGLGAMLTKKGVKRKDKVLAKGIITSKNYMADKLNLTLGEEVYLIQRIRFANDSPFAVEYCFVPFKYFPDIDEHNFENTSLYEYMKSKGHFPIDFDQKLIILESYERLSKLLEVPDGTPLYYFEFLSRDKDGNAIEYTESFIDCDKTIFNFEIENEKVKH